MDTAKTARVVIDLQKGITFHEIISNAAHLTDHFRKNGMPVF